MNQFESIWFISCNMHLLAVLNMKCSGLARSSQGRHLLHCIDCCESHKKTRRNLKFEMLQVECWSCLQVDTAAAKPSANPMLAWYSGPCCFGTVVPACSCILCIHCFRWMAVGSWPYGFHSIYSKSHTHEDVTMSCDSTPFFEPEEARRTHVGLCCRALCRTAVSGSIQAGAKHARRSR